MKGWLQTLGLTALLAGQALANDVELVSKPSMKLQPIGISQSLMVS
jgi:hypothetical protein